MRSRLFTQLWRHIHRILLSIERSKREPVVPLAQLPNTLDAQPLCYCVRDPQFASLTRVRDCASSRHALVQDMFVWVAINSERCLTHFTKQVNPVTLLEMTCEQMDLITCSERYLTHLNSLEDLDDRRRKGRRILGHHTRTSIGDHKLRLSMIQDPPVGASYSTRE